MRLLGVSQVQRALPFGSSFRSSLIRALRLSVATSVTATVLVVGLPAASAQAAYAPPSSIATDCSRDVAAEITSWIASVPNGSTLSFAPGVCYRIDGTIIVRNRSSLVFEGNGATFRAFLEAGNGRHHWFLDQGSNLTLRNMTIVGSDPTPGTFETTQEHQHGVNVWRTQGALLENLTIRNVHGDFVYVGHHNGTPARDILVLGGRFSGAGRQGVAVVNGERITVDGTFLEKVGNSVFDLEPGSLDLIRDVTLRNTTVGDHRHLFLPSNVVPATNVLIANNRILGGVGDRWPDGPGSSWPTVDAASGGANWIVRNNDFARFENSALRFAGVTGVTVACNRIRWVYGTGVGVTANGGQTIRVTNNRFVGATGSFAGSATDVVSTGNALTDTALPSTCGSIGPVTLPAPSIALNAPSSFYAGISVNVSASVNVPHGRTHRIGWSTTRSDCRFTSASGPSSTFYCPAAATGSGQVTATVVDSLGMNASMTRTFTLKKPNPRRTVTAGTRAVGKIRRGAKTTLYGRAIDSATGKPIVGMRVSISYRVAGTTTWKKITTKSTNLTGYVALTVKPRRTTYYRIVTRTSATWASDRSTVRRIRVI